jgi:hypothetical protein
VLSGPKAKQYQEHKRVYFIDEWICRSSTAAGSGKGARHGNGDGGAVFKEHMHQSTARWDEVVQAKPLDRMCRSAEIRCSVGGAARPRNRGAATGNDARGKKKTKVSMYRIKATHVHCHLCHRHTKCGHLRATTLLVPTLFHNAMRCVGPTYHSHRSYRKDRKYRWLALQARCRSRMPPSQRRPPGDKGILFLLQTPRN